MYTRRIEKVARVQDNIRGTAQKRSSTYRTAPRLDTDGVYGIEPRTTGRGKGFTFNVGRGDYVTAQTFQNTQTYEEGKAPKKKTVLARRNLLATSMK